MTNSLDYTKTVSINNSSDKVFSALTKHISKWWSENFEGKAEAVNDEFTVRFGDTFKTIRIINVEKDKQVGWLCIDQHLEMPPGFPPLTNKKEWVGNKIVWEIDPAQEKCALKLTHFGLTPEVECWGVCETGWDQSLKSLVAFVEHGKGAPFQQLDQEHLERAIDHQEKRR